MNTGFKITDVGLAAATLAGPSGPYINIAQFRVGSGFNYIPNGTETGLAGTTLYTGVPLAFTQIGVDTIEVLLVMDPTVGPFNFGEVGIYLSTGELFALSVFSTLQEKLNVVGNQAGTRWAIRARLRLAQLPAICTVTILNANQLLELPSWAALPSPDNLISPTNAVIVHEENRSDDSILVIKDSTTQWSVLGYTKVIEEDTSNPGVAFTTTTVTAPSFLNLSLELPETKSRYLVKFPNGIIRRIASQPSPGVFSFTPAVAVPGTGVFSILEDCCGSGGGTIRYADTYEYNQLVLDFNPYWAVPSGSYSDSNKGLNEDPIPTIVSRPTIPNWNRLINAIRAACQVHGVPFADIVTTNFAYPPVPANGWGLHTIAQVWNTLVGKISLLEANRNVSDPVYQDLSVSTLTDSTRLPDWSSGTIRHRASYTFATNDDLLGFINGGFTVRNSAQVLAGSSNLWTNTNTLLSSIGTITINRASTICSTGIQPPNGLGFYTVPSGVDTVVFQRTQVFGSRNIQVRLILNMTSPTVITVTLELIPTGYGSYYSGADGELLSRFRVTKPASSVLTAPVKSFPTETLLLTL